MYDHLNKILLGNLVKIFSLTENANNTFQNSSTIGYKLYTLYLSYLVAISQPDIILSTHREPFCIRHMQISVYNVATGFLISRNYSEICLRVVNKWMKP